MFARRLAPAALILTVALTGCGSSDSDGESAATESSTTASTTTSESTAAETGTLTVTDPWIKAVDSGMTAAFGTLENSGSSEITVVSASSDVSPEMELHETVEQSDGTMAMQPKEGGFTIPAGGTHELSPGGDHIMMMGVSRALEPGEKVAITLTLSDSSTVDLEAVVKEYSGADENYIGGDDDMTEDMGEMDMDGE